MLTVGRTSFSDTLARIIAAILLAGLLPGVRAEQTADLICTPPADLNLPLYQRNASYHREDFEHCDRLSSAARAGIDLIFFLLFLALVFSLVTYRRRRPAQANLAYVQQNQHSVGGI
ncbi:hypothetical protein H4582DRAFT_1116824 [Lactarius indigo]|nr:hypothetical protein H4582DRAFT_1116824 [Lactarius indigo]